MYAFIVSIIVSNIMISGGISAWTADLQPSQEGQRSVTETIKGKDGAPMMLIPAGPFTMGGNDGLLPNGRSIR